MSRFIEMSLSKDGGHTFSDPAQRPLPDWGQYSDPMPKWLRLGIGRQFQAQWVCTEPCTLKVIAVSIQT